MPPVLPWMLPLLKKRLLLLLLTLAAAPFALLAATPEPEVFTIKTLAAQMRYDVTELTISPGAQVKIVFENPDDMPHNMVFFQPGTDVVEVCNRQMEKPEEALKRNWLPEDPRMWLHSKMLNPKDREEIVFKAPEKPGIYPFVCTFPGHAVTMQGRLKIFAPGPKLTDGKFAVYLGDWDKLPDFSKLTPHREGALPDNLLQIQFDDYKNQFGIVYTGRLTVPKDGNYTFAIACDDGGRLLIDGQKLIEHDGIHPSAQIKEGKAKLKAGEHDFRLEYFQAAGEAQLYAAWRSEEFALTPLSKWVHPNWRGAGAKKKNEAATGMPLTVGAEPVVYRNFISGAGNRGIGVGYPGGFNLAWSAESLSLALVWRGAFIDAARHWKDRGAGAQPPLGYDVLRLSPDPAPPFAVLASAASAEWPKLRKGERAEGYRWKGYTLDEKRFPTFRYEWNGVQVADRFDVEGDAVAGSGRLVRTLTLTGALPAGAMFCAVTADKISPAGNGAFAVEGGKFGWDGSTFENRFTVSVDGAQLSGRHLLVPARPEIKIIYAWPAAHAHAHHAHAHAH